MCYLISIRGELIVNIMECLSVANEDDGWRHDGFQILDTVDLGMRKRGNDK